jgi:hypothetical protein
MRDAVSILGALTILAGLIGCEAGVRHATADDIADESDPVGCQPKPESCNGLDDDCNGLTDDGLCQPDTDPCTIDKCAVGGGCTHERTPEGEPCDDGDACVVKAACFFGDCRHLEFKKCPGGKLCLAQCDPKTGACSTRPDGSPCGYTETCFVGGGTCQGGFCTGVLDAKLCDHGNPCLEHSCDLVTDLENGQERGTCVPKSPTVNPCPKSDVPCLENVCVGQGFLSGVHCGSVPNYSAKCDDGSTCTQEDHCTNDGCVGEAISCDDANPCTKDTCDPKSGCTHAALPDLSACGTGMTCVAGVCS